MAHSYAARSFLEKLLHVMQTMGNISWIALDYEGFHTHFDGHYVQISRYSSRAGPELIFRVVRINDGAEEFSIRASYAHSSELPFFQFLRKCSLFLKLPYPRRWDGPVTEEEHMQECLRQDLEKLYSYARENSL